MGLNPYSNGMEIELEGKKEIVSLRGLNPYSNGMEIELCCFLFYWGA